MQVTVTGGTGFLGSFLVRDLLAKGVAVRVFGRPSARAGVLRLLGAEILPGDLSDITALARAIDGSEIVYHLAAKVGLPRARTTSRPTLPAPKTFSQPAPKNAFDKSSTPARWRCTAPCRRRAHR